MSCAHTQEYVATGQLGVETDTLDTEGKEILQRPFQHITKEMMESVRQSPPLSFHLKLGSTLISRTTHARTHERTNACTGAAPVCGEHLADAARLLCAKDQRREGVQAREVRQVFPTLTRVCRATVARVLPERVNAFS
jgi:hypothetical protein